MKPLHRIVGWEPHPVHMPVVLCVFTWLVTGMWFYIVVAGVVVNTYGPKATDGWNGGGLVTFLAYAFALAAIVQTIRLLWQWEERNEVKTAASERRIKELEDELGIGSDV